MRKNALLFISFICIAFLTGRSAFPQVSRPPISDSLERQVIYNGKVWRSLYSKIIGDQFLYFKEFMPGSISIDGKRFAGLEIRYDIYNDEILTLTDRSIIIQVNKEMVDSFTIDYLGKTHNFSKLEPDSVNSLSGYVEVLYHGNSSLYVRSRKEIQYLAAENQLDMFEQSQKIYLKKNGKIYPVRGKPDFLGYLKDHKKEVKSFIKSRKITMTKGNPESFVPVLEYYDSLHQ
ncbi:MAG: hypothetical protein WCE64_11715 [Bacteroidales bacterium]